MSYQEQKRFMKGHLGFPSGQTITMLVSRIQQLKGLLPYLLGKGNKFNADNVQGMIHNVLTTYSYIQLFVTFDYK
jgi:hypothetical protein